MEWILLLYIVGAPNSTGVMTQPSESRCHEVAATWRKIGEKHRAFCIYGDVENLNVEVFLYDNAPARIRQFP